MIMLLFSLPSFGLGFLACFGLFVLFGIFVAVMENAVPVAQYDKDGRYVSGWCIGIFIVLIVLLAIFASAQPAITRIVYQVCPPIADGVEYAPGDAVLYSDFNDSTNNAALSGSVYLGAVAEVSLTWTTRSNHAYAVEAASEFNSWRAPFVRVSPWLYATSINLSFTQAAPEAQRFYRIVEQ